MKVKLGKYNVIGYVCLILAFLINFYISLPALNIHSNAFWSGIIVYLALGAVFSLPFKSDIYAPDGIFKVLIIVYVDIVTLELTEYSCE